MRNDDPLIDLVKQQFNFRGKVILTRPNAERAIQHLGCETVLSDFHAEPRRDLVTLRPLRPDIFN